MALALALKMLGTLFAALCWEKRRLVSFFGSRKSDSLSHTSNYYEFEEEIQVDRYVVAETGTKQAAVVKNSAVQSASAHPPPPTPKTNSRLKMTLQSKLRLLTLTALAISLICRVAYCCLVWQPQEEAELKTTLWITSLLFLVFNWFGISLYILCVIDRFQRIELVLPKSSTERVLKAAKVLIVTVCTLICIGETYNKVVMIIGDTKYMVLDWQVGLAELFQIFVVVIIEFLVNLRLVQSVLKQEHITPLPRLQHEDVLKNGKFPFTIGSSSADSESTTPTPSPPLSGFKTKKHQPSPVPSKAQIAKTRLRRMMIALFSLLLLFDILGILLFSLGGQHVLPSDETINISNAILILHFYCSFKLLDLLLHLLHQLKKSTRQ